MQSDIRLTTDTLDTSPDGYNSWDLKLPDSTGYGMSVTVTDADRSVPSPATIEKLAEVFTDDLTVPNHLVDSSYITFTGKATKENYLFGGKNIKDPFSREIVMTGVRDSNFVFIKTTRMGDGGNSFWIRFSFLVISTCSTKSTKRKMEVQRTFT